MKPSDRRSIRSVDCAVSRYVRSVRRGSVPCRADGDANSQAANYRDAVERAELRAEQIRHILNERGVSLIQFAVYRNFGLHVDKLCRAYSGESLRLMVSDATERWTSYGCSPEILTEIRENVFGLTLASSRKAVGG
jgi:hypothetical protein